MLAVLSIAPITTTNAHGYKCGIHLQWPISERIQHPLQPAELASSPFGPGEVVNFLFQEAFSAGSVGVLNVSEGAEFSSPSVYQPITGLLTKSFGQRVRNVCETVFSHSCAGGCWKWHKGAEFSRLQLVSTSYRPIKSPVLRGWWDNKVKTDHILWLEIDTDSFLLYLHELFYQIHNFIEI